MLVRIYLLYVDKFKSICCLNNDNNNDDNNNDDGNNNNNNKTLYFTEYFKNPITYC